MSEEDTPDPLEERIVELERTVEVLRGQMMPVVRRDLPLLTRAMRALVDREVEDVTELPEATGLLAAERREARAQLEDLEAWIAALDEVRTEMTSKEEKFATVLAFALDNRGDRTTVSVTPHEIRECTGVSRRYAYDLIDAMGSSLSGCAVRESDVVETITGSTRRSKALLVDCETVMYRGQSVGPSDSDGEIPGEAGEVNAASNATNESAAVALEELTALTPRGFEEYVADVWRAQGYTCCLTKQSGDNGVDVIAEKGDERLLIQAKRYSDQDVGIEIVQRMAGLLVDDEFNPSKVMVVTTSGFTQDAERCASRITGLELVDGPELVALGVDVDVGTSDGERRYETALTADQVLSVVEGREPKTTTEIARALDEDQRSVMTQLESLAGDEKIRVKEVGEGHFIWYR
jgi:hypothetical protein